MSLVLDLPAELETELAAEAALLKLALTEYVLRLLAAGRTPPPAPRTGAELLAYWQSKSLVGTRPDIADSAAHARALREHALPPALNELLSGVTVDNLPGEWDTGRAAGKEVC